ncbi:MAG: 23S rRNA (pseudouridine(1915)-N(3))-methyltransferase RlmH [Oscillospiraceae bacterium]|nr:23S rRNA (pseudouridine(1915)-N(3))-methyltransferase RlmH [Oscillospiraceae bacterium]
MLNIEIICAGRIKETHYQAACAEYAKRLLPYCKLTVIEQPEGKPINIPDDRIYTIALTPEGKTQTSYDFSREFWSVGEAHSKLRFLIGGSDGLFPKDLARANEALSLSRMTFTHAMARVLLLEQIYRACMIRIGKKYHK